MAVFDSRGGRKYLNDQERRRLLAAIRRERDASRRAFCLTLFYTGCRISEALKLTVERVDLSERCLVFETLKRRRSGAFRSVPISDALCALLRPLLNERAPDARIWKFSRTTGYRLIKRLMAKASIDGSMASPKGMRHSMAVSCLEHKIPLTTVRTWLGHSKLETTAIYLAVSGPEERRLARRLWSKPCRRRN